MTASTRSRSSAARRPWFASGWLDTGRESRARLGVGGRQVERVGLGEQAERQRVGGLGLARQGQDLGQSRMGLQQLKVFRAGEANPH